MSEVEAPETGAAPAAQHPDRAWRIARWVVAVPAFIVSVAVLVVSALALYYAHKTSTEDVRAGIARTYSNVQRQLSETQQLIEHANQTLGQVQENAKKARTSAAQAQANLQKTLTELQTSVDQINRSLSEGAKTQQQILSELTAISKQLDTIEQSKPATTG